MKRRYMLVVVSVLVMFVVSACSKSTPQAPQSGATEIKTTEAAQMNVSKEDIVWPERDIQVIVSAKPGGGSDITGRITNKYLEKYLGKTLVTVNVAGAGGTLGARQVKDAEPDGYTIAYHNDGLVSAYAVGSCDFNHTAFRSSKICAVCTNVTFVTTKQFKTFDEFVSYAKEHPGKLKYGVQSGNYQEQMAAILMRDLGIEVEIVDVGTVSDILVAMLGGHIDMTCGPMGTVREYIESGDLVSHGILAQERHEDYPDIPTMEELGVQYYLPKYFLYYFPLNTPDDVIEKFNEALGKVTEDEEYIAEMKAQDFDVVSMSEDESVQYQDNALMMFTEYQKVLDAYKASK